MRSQLSTTPAVDRIRYSNGPLRSPPSRGTCLLERIGASFLETEYRSGRRELVSGTGLFGNSSINPAIVQTKHSFGELVFSDRAQSLPCQDVDLGIHVVN